MKCNHQGDSDRETGIRDEVATFERVVYEGRDVEGCSSTLASISRTIERSDR